MCILVYAYLNRQDRDHGEHPLSQFLRHHFLTLHYKKLQYYSTLAKTVYFYACIAIVVCACECYTVVLFCHFLATTSTNCAGSRAICPRPCTPHTAAHPIHALCLRRPAPLALWIFMIDRQRLAVGGSVDYGVVHINYVVTWTANQSAWWPWPWKWCPSHVCYLCANFGLPIGLSVLDLGPMYAKDRRQTDRRQDKSID